MTIYAYERYNFWTMTILHISGNISVFPEFEVYMEMSVDISVSVVYSLFDPIAQPHFLGPDQLSLIKDDFDRTKFIHRYRPLSRALHCS